MDCIVQKYGGSSVSDPERIRAVAARVAEAHAQGLGVCVVVSAMGGTTDRLLALASEVSPHPEARELDMLVSCGERTSMALLALALHARGVPARSLTGSQAGIVTDERHADARVVEVRPNRLRQVLEAGSVAVVAGFQGVSRDREVTTLGRGGSDTTAVVLAAALGARWCEICSDVDGVWSADPRVVPGAVRRDAVGIDEALSLARAGAKVLFEDAVRYARDHGVEIRARSTFGPGAGTRLVSVAPRSGPVTAVTGDGRLALVRLGDDASATVQAVRAAGGRIRRRVDDRLWVDLRNAHAGLPVAWEPAAVVTAVGSGLGERADVAWAIEQRLGAARIACLASGGEADACWWQVPLDRLDDAVRCVHATHVAGHSTTKVSI